MSKTFKIVDGDISDGFHTFDELYEHRCLLFILLALKWPGRTYWRPHYEGWPLIGMVTPAGQITYHVPEKYLPLFEDKIEKGGPEWDGHDSKEVISRLFDWCKWNGVNDAWRKKDQDISGHLAQAAHDSSGAK